MTVGTVELTGHTTDLTGLTEIIQSISEISIGTNQQTLVRIRMFVVVIDSSISMSHIFAGRTKSQTRSSTGKTAWVTNRANVIVGSNIGVVEIADRTIGNTEILSIVKEKAELAFSTVIVLGPAKNTRGVARNA